MDGAWVYRLAEPAGVWKTRPSIPHFAFCNSHQQRILLLRQHRRAQRQQQRLYGGIGNCTASIAPSGTCSSASPSIRPRRRFTTAVVSLTSTGNGSKSAVTLPLRAQELPVGASLAPNPVTFPNQTAGSTSAAMAVTLTMPVPARSPASSPASQGQTFDLLSRRERTPAAPCSRLARPVTSMSLSRGGRAPLFGNALGGR